MSFRKALKLVGTAFRAFWNYRDMFFCLAILPAIALLLIAIPLTEVMQTVFTANENTRMDIVMSQAPRLMGLSLLYFAVLCLFSVNWLRFLAFGRKKGESLLGLRLSKAHLRFTVAAFALLIIQTVLFDLLFLFLGKFIPLLLIVFIGFLAGLFFLLRFLPYLIGLALDRAISLRDSWKISPAHFGTYFLAILAAQIPLFLIEEGIAELLSSSSLVDQAPYACNFLLAGLELLRLAITLQILFLFYRRGTELEILA